MNTKTIRNQISKLMALAAGLSLTFAVPTTTDAAAYIKFDGVDGESKDDKHDKWIDVLSIDWGIHKPGGGATGQSRRRGDVVVEDVNISINYEKASPKLLEACLTGKVFPKVEIELTASYGANSGGAEDPPRRVVYLHIELRNVLITSTGFHYQASASDEERPAEEFALNYEEIKVTYTEYDGQGNDKGKVEASWKVEKGEK